MNNLVVTIGDDNSKAFYVMQVVTVSYTRLFGLTNDATNLHLYNSGLFSFVYRLSDISILKTNAASNMVFTFIDVASFRTL